MTIIGINKNITSLHYYHCRDKIFGGKSILQLGAMPTAVILWHRVLWLHMGNLVPESKLKYTLVVGPERDQKDTPPPLAFLSLDFINLSVCTCHKKNFV